MWREHCTPVAKELHAIHKITNTDLVPLNVLLLYSVHNILMYASQHV